MASTSDDDQAPEASQFSSFEEATRFFQENGFLYQTIPEIGKLFTSLGPEAKTRDGFNKYFKDIVFHHQHLKQFLEPYTQNLPAYAISLGADPTHYFTLTVDQEIHQGHGQPIAVYIWREGTKLECAQGSPSGKFITQQWGNRMFLIPYPQIKGQFKEIPAIMEGGGM
ncbi:unnamed protein product [Clonostachys chloroleuca]|uniref:Uncharacterized protein n=1 Tax=Clonostachys chloroleuca TaxID=1926264 RepID=A0AA35QGA7_9HYPO|nr:unnamed protein product [Clonostachys chloroleuca]